MEYQYHSSSKYKSWLDAALELDAHGDNIVDKLASSTNIQNCQSCGWHHVGLEIIKGNYYECPVTKLIGEISEPLEGGEKNEKGTES